MLKQAIPLTFHWTGINGRQIPEKIVCQNQYGGRPLSLSWKQDATIFTRISELAWNDIFLC